MDDAVRIVQIEPDHFEALEELQRICFPMLGAQELMRVEHYESQHRLFRDGQFVALAGDRVIGQGSGFLLDFDFEHPQHTFREICAGFYFTNHNPNGAYYYGADISVHPDWRGRGIGGRILGERKNLVRRLNRRGIVAGGMIPDYVAHRSIMTPQEYVEQVTAGALHDATLNFQLRNGFRVRGMIQGYMEDSSSDNWATLIEWVNPDYRPE